jgi:hypothetical protein
MAAQQPTDIKRTDLQQHDLAALSTILELADRRTQERKE